MKKQVLFCVIAAALCSVNVADAQDNRLPQSLPQVYTLKDVSGRWSNCHGQPVPDAIVCQEAGPTFYRQDASVCASYDQGKQCPFSIVWEQPAKVYTHILDIDEGYVVEGDVRFSLIAPGQLANCDDLDNNVNTMPECLEGPSQGYEIQANGNLDVVAADCFHA